LLHGENRTSTGQNLMEFADGATDQELYSHAYPGEDLQKVRTILRPGSYHCVVANPPYIVPKDRKLGDWYRKRFRACHMQYSLSVPFLQQIFQLAVQGGFTGQITANSFMKREFGKKLVEAFLPSVELTHVVDTSGAYIPGHGTPTVLLFGRNRAPLTSTIRTVMGIAGEPSTPSDPSKGFVWRSILDQIDESKSENEYVSSADSDRGLFSKHPWSIGGGGAAELKLQLEQCSELRLESHIEAYGRGMHTGADDVYLAPRGTIRRFGVPTKYVVPAVKGEDVRDWLVFTSQEALFPYDNQLTACSPLPDTIERYLWQLRAILRSRRELGGTHEEIGLTWFEWSRFHPERFATNFRIGTANIATHFHSAMDRVKRAYDVTAPLIRLSDDKSVDEHLMLLGCLNSSSGCFWMKQVCFPKGGDHVGQEGARVRRSLWDERYAFNGTNIEKLPIPSEKPLETTQCIEYLSQQLASLNPYTILAQSINSTERDAKAWGSSATLRESLSASRKQWLSIREQMIASQENLDWECYRLYGLVVEDLAEPNPRTSWVPVALGQRAFEIVHARKISAGESQSSWFERHGTIPTTELPVDWPDDYKNLIERRIDKIENDPNIRLIEQPEYKRRWNTEPWESQLERALRAWLLLRLETYFDVDGRMTDPAEVGKRRVPLGEVAMYSVAQLADAARRDPQLMEVGELYRDDPAFDVQVLVEELVLAESVPHLPIHRYKDSGLRKRAEWERTWNLQRREDALSDQLSAISDQLKQASDVNEKKRLEAECEKLTAERCSLTASIPVPPKYTSADFISTGGARYWSLRGKLDVPKERWISFPHCEGPDGTLVICWAGYDHLQQAQAISVYYVRVQTEFGGSDDPRLIPLLASLIELLPWLKQWHNDPNANFDGLRMGDYFEGFVNEEARALGKTLDEIRAWTPPKGQRGRVTRGQSGRKKGQSRKGSKGQSEEGAAEA
jgi:hypothetical protein